jgi:aminobenzoyl-glutamate transport protein
MAYFVIYLAYLEKFDKSGAGVMKSIRYLIPYALFLLGMWIIILLIWTVVKLPLGIGTGVLL